MVLPLFASWLLAATGPAGAGSISGTVTDAGGEPLDDVVVYAFDLRLGYASAAANAEGSYRIAALPSGRYRLAAWTEGHLDAMSRYWPDAHSFCDGTLLDLTDGADLEGYDFVLEPGGVVEGRVLDDQGEPVEGADVEAEGADSYSDGYDREATTEEDGTFRIAGLDAPEGEAASYRLVVEASGWPEQYLGQVYEEETADVLEVERGSTVAVGDWTLLPGIEVEGRVTDTEGSPLEATVHVYAGGQVSSVTTGEDGTYHADGLPPGEVLPWSVADGYANTYWPDADRPESFAEASQEGERLEGMDLEMPPEAVFSAWIDGDADFSDATALLYNDTGTVGFGASLESDGYFEVGGLHGGSYHLYVFASDEGYVDDYVRDSDGEPVVYEVEDETWGETVSASLPEGAVLSGTVSDEEGEPLYGAYVYATNRDSGDIEVATTDDEGAWELAGLPEGQYALEARYSHYCSADPGYVTVYWQETVNETFAATLVLAGGDRTGPLDFSLPFDHEHDEMGDTWESDHGLDPDRDDAGEDPDGDTYTNLEEYRMGTDPLSGYEQEGCSCAAAPSPQRLAWGLVPLLAVLRRRRDQSRSRRTHMAPTGRPAWPDLRW